MINKQFNVVHHLYPFDKILNETFLETCILKKEYLKEFSEEKQVILSNKCIELHSKYPLGVCLTIKAHKLFHNIYGNVDNTPEQFYQFKKDFEAGKYDNEYKATK